MAEKPKRKTRKPPPDSLNNFDDFDEFDEGTAAAKSKQPAENKTKKTSVAKKRRKRRATRTDPLGETSTTGEISGKSAPRPSVVLDPRKYTKKQRSKLQAWTGQARGKTLDTYFKGQIEQARKIHGHRSVMAASGAGNLVVVLPCPLPMQYVLAQDGFPLSIVVHLHGEPASYKTALLVEIGRWFRNYGGGIIYMENETKYNPAWPQSILGFSDYEVGMILNRCVSVEDWQEKTIYWIKTQQKNMVGTKEEPGPGRCVPILLGVDSIVGKASYETQEKVVSDGYGSRAHPVEALSINQFLKTVPHMLDEWPFTLVLNNHLKIRKDSDGKDVGHTGGGKSVNFQEGYELQTKVVKRRIQSAAWEGAQIRVTCLKNSFGPTFRQIETRVLWWEEEDENHGWVQKTVFDWDWSIVKLLSTLKGRPAAKLQDAGFHLKTPKTSDVENTAWSKTLGMTEKDALPWQEVGRMIRSDPALVKKLQKALAIASRPVLAGDYLSQLEELREGLP